MLEWCCPLGEARNWALLSCLAFLPWTHNSYFWCWQCIYCAVCLFPRLKSHGCVNQNRMFLKFKLVRLLLDYVCAHMKVNLTRLLLIALPVLNCWETAAGCSWRLCSQLTDWCGDRPGSNMAALKMSACDARGRCRDGRGGEIVKMGYLRKLKVCDSICCKERTLYSVILII
jgi:hypothetical protein